VDKALASAILDDFVRELRKHNYLELRELIRAPQCEEKCGPDGKAYQVEFEAHWDDPRNRGHNLRVIVSIDDGTFRASLCPITRSFIMAPDGTFVGEALL
jgi:hypothetical protein